MLIIHCTYFLSLWQEDVEEIRVNNKKKKVFQSIRLEGNLSCFTVLFLSCFPLFFPSFSRRRRRRHRHRRRCYTLVEGY
jgi:hypothetical protein